MTSTTKELLQATASEQWTCSWAVWEEDDISFPDNPSGLHNRAVFIAGNPGNRAADPDRTPWQNFHTGRRHNDHLIAAALRGRPEWGCFMTDFLSQVESNSTRIDRGAKPVAAGVEELARRIEMLGTTTPTLLLAGGDAVKLAKPANLQALAEKLGVTTAEIEWCHLPHYSRANARMHGQDPQVYRALVDWSLRHPRTRHPWREPGAPKRS